MNDTSGAHYRALIETRLDALDREDQLGRSGQATVTLDQQAVGRLSRQDALQNQAMAKATHARRQTERKRLRAALARIDAGEFGYCDSCGEDIAPGRLELDPAATRCVDCARG
ncbi:MAG: TraR/DksA family transcriptional regulator [Pseudomonadota bacterium]|uniref:TraR/DksA family transcriptional regulator n=1 Tax=Roseovarius TaxID=74030 RepID=UPI0022A76175|nr:TraR/DksA C4-type zinc finger protein [Roseovarius sp. EGI FJ00037]MCZ0810711.1 TraR/DksA C4-type zinc finger protein [Roseovarius sp. EGI FJ00037]